MRKFALVFQDNLDHKMYYFIVVDSFGMIVHIGKHENTT